jgi:long-subunit fatty acid transport protein
MKTSFRTMSALALAIATASGSAYSAQLEEVIVTAQKRAESYAGRSYIHDSCLRR